VVGCGPSEAALYSGLGKPALWIANGVPITPLHKGPGSDLIVFTGIATAQKDPAFFNRVAEALSGVKEAAFCWVGDGPLRDSLCSGNIKVSGWQDRKTVDDYLSRALVYFSTSAWEGLPYGVLEAMNAACALLLRNVPGNRELVIPGENGCLFDTEEEAAALLAEMLKNRQKTLDMGARSRLLAESRYSAVLMGEKYRNLYNTVIAGDISRPVLSGNHISHGAA
jgi:glycosyltransferase involved in cell wall biosynthesis